MILLFQEPVSCLDPKVYIDKHRNIEATDNHKETDRRSYVHSKFEHQLCLKKSISFGQE